MSTTHQTKLANLRQQVASLQHALEVVNRNRHAETDLLRLALDESFKNVRSLTIDLDAARWSLRQLQSRASSATPTQDEPRTPVRLPPTPAAPVKDKAKRTRDDDDEEDAFVQDERASRRARRQLRVARRSTVPAPARREYGRVLLANHDKYRFVTHREAEARADAARQAEYAEFY